MDELDWWEKWVRESFDFDHLDDLIMEQASEREREGDNTASYSGRVPRHATMGPSCEGQQA
jgi:hypothetical protein